MCAARGEKPTCGLLGHALYEQFRSSGSPDDRSRALSACEHACKLGESDSCHEAMILGNPNRRAFTEQVAGFRFGKSPREIVAKCRDAKRSATVLKDGAVVCSGVAEPVGFEAMVRVEFCATKACEMKLVRTRGPGLGGEDDQHDWLQVFDELRAKLIDKYGLPTSIEGQISDSCRADISGCPPVDHDWQSATWAWYSVPGQKLTSVVDLSQNTVLIRIIYANSESAKAYEKKTIGERMNL